jgi:aminoglycoside/choline kinase family phosphotransferase
MEEKKNQIVDAANQLLHKHIHGNSPHVTGMKLLCGDGSQRIFYRLILDDNTSIVAVLPNEDNPLNRAEAASAWQICRHLYHVRVPVPEPLAFDRESGLLLFEDLGDTRLYDLLRKDGGLREDSLFTVYRNIVKELVCMQVEGREGFDISWCWQTPHYDRELMLERESGYFLQSLCRDFFNLEPDINALNVEFGRIADVAAMAPDGFFLHRDFQSRNIMIKDGAVRIIDFQGGRLGPLGYDLASLLIDPYVCLSPELQETLYDEYLFELLKRVHYDPLAFREEYLYLSLQRNLQILGAFAFLGKQRSKVFFLPFIQPALVSMQALLVKVNRHQYPVLAGLIDICLERIETEEI